MIRNLMLYPAELRGRTAFSAISANLAGKASGTERSQRAQRGTLAAQFRAHWLGQGPRQSMPTRRAETRNGAPFMGSAVGEAEAPNL